ncbi:MAG: hypothetical protein BAJATHORv1_20176 [Candidatus Thorarchaeota archaeon]|nr:MAG: hypothetical protein BAJATHORv1_20176 [Candidatus Thorarchaeota archaeon]
MNQRGYHQALLDCVMVFVTARIVFKSLRVAIERRVTDLKTWLMDILACPAENCRNKLEIDVYTQHEIKIDDESVTEIDEALLTCPKCDRWYPVIDGIVCMLPDTQRMEGKQRIEETKFLRRWKDNIPSRILENGTPFGLSEE